MGRKPLEFTPPEGRLDFENLSVEYRMKLIAYQDEIFRAKKQLQESDVRMTALQNKLENYLRNKENQLAEVMFTAHTNAQRIEAQARSQVQYFLDEMELELQRKQQEIRIIEEKTSRFDQALVSPSEPLADMEKGARLSVVEGSGGETEPAHKIEKPDIKPEEALPTAKKKMRVKVEKARPDKADEPAGKVVPPARVPRPQDEEQKAAPAEPGLPVATELVRDMAAEAVMAPAADITGTRPGPEIPAAAAEGAGPETEPEVAALDILAEVPAAEAEAGLADGSRDLKEPEASRETPAMEEMPVGMETGAAADAIQAGDAITADELETAPGAGAMDIAVEAEAAVAAAETPAPEGSGEGPPASPAEESPATEAQLLITADTGAEGSLPETSGIRPGAEPELKSESVSGPEPGPAVEPVRAAEPEPAPEAPVTAPAAAKKVEINERMQLDAFIDVRYFNDITGTRELYHHALQITVEVDVPSDNYSVRYTKVSSDVVSTLMKYDNVVLNDLHPFNFVAPNPNSIATYFFNLLDDMLQMMDLGLHKMTMTEFPDMCIVVDRRNTAFDNMLHKDDDIFQDIRDSLPACVEAEPRENSAFKGTLSRLLKKRI